MTASRPATHTPRPKLGRLTVGATAGLMLVFGFAGPAAASSLPSCATVTHDVGFTTQTVWVQNNCSTALTARVLKIGPVTNPCFTIPAHQKVGWRWARMWTYVMTESC